MNKGFFDIVFYIVIIGLAFVCLLLMFHSILTIHEIELYETNLCCKVGMQYKQYHTCINNTHICNIEENYLECRKINRIEIYE